MGAERAAQGVCSWGSCTPWTWFVSFLRPYKKCPVAPGSKGAAGLILSGPLFDCSGFPPGPGYAASRFSRRLSCARSRESSTESATDEAWCWMSWLAALLTTRSSPQARTLRVVLPMVLGIVLIICHLLQRPYTSFGADFITGASCTLRAMLPKMDTAELLNVKPQHRIVLELAKNEAFHPPRDGGLSRPQSCSVVSRCSRK